MHFAGYDKIAPGMGRSGGRLERTLSNEYERQPSAGVALYSGAPRFKACGLD
jgi:hypothetical protein